MTFKLFQSLCVTQSSLFFKLFIECLSKFSSKFVIYAKVELSWFNVYKKYYKREHFILLQQ